MRRVAAGLLTVTLLLLVACANTPTASEGPPGANVLKQPVPTTSPWPMTGHDPQYTGRSEYRGPASPKVKWRAATPAPVITSPVISRDGTVYVGCADGFLRAFNPDGSKKWEFSIHGAVRSTLAIGTDGTLYVGSNDKNIYAVNPDGTKKWSLETGDSDVGDLVIARDGSLYAVVLGKCWAITPEGTRKWQIDAGTGSIGVDGTLYRFDSDTATAFSPEGKVIWAKSGRSFWAGDSRPARGEVFYQSGSGSFQALDSRGTAWEFPTGARTGGGYAIARDGTLYGGALDGRFYAIGTDGTMKWDVLCGGPLTTRAVDPKSGVMHIDVEIGAPVTSSPAIGSDGMIYLNCNDGTLRVVNPSGVVKWEIPTGSAPASMERNGGRLYAQSPAIGANGALYLGTSWGLLAIGEKR